MSNFTGGGGGAGWISTTHIQLTEIRWIFSSCASVHITPGYGWTRLWWPVKVVLFKTRQLGHPRSPANRFRNKHHNFCYIYIGYRFPLSLSTIWGNHLPVNFMLKFPTCISTIWRNHLPHLTSKWRGTFQYFQSHDKMPYIYYLEKPPPI